MFSSLWSRRAPSGHAAEPGSVTVEANGSAFEFSRKSMRGERLRGARSIEFDRRSLRSEIEGADDLFVAVTAGERDGIARRQKDFDLALGEGRMGLSEDEEPSIVLEHGRRIALLAVD